MRALALVTLLLGGFQSVQAQSDWEYTVRSGDSIWTITERYLYSSHLAAKLTAYNQISAPKMLKPGAIVKIPVKWLRVQPATATVLHVHGDVWSERTFAVGRSRPVTTQLAVGDTLEFGAKIRTAPGARLTVQLADKSVIVLEENTEMHLDTMSAYKGTGMVDSQIRLLRGRIENKTQKQRGPGSRFEITTPAAVAVVRGTEFRMAVPEEVRSETRGEVTEGAITMRGGNARRVNEGFGVVAREGERLPAPVRLLPAPDLSALPDPFERVQMLVEWPSVSGAAGYRFSLFSDASKQRLLISRVVDRASVLIEAPPDGSYFINVRAISASGLEGLDSERAININARPVPPIAVKPDIDAKLFGEPPQLWWALPEDTAATVIRVFAAGDNTPLFEQRVAELDKVRLKQMPPPGDYIWRLATIDAAGETGPMGEPRAFRVLAVPEPVKPDDPKIDEQSLSFSWGEVAHAQQYKFEFGHDGDFDPPIFVETVSDRKIEIPRPGHGTYYFRIRGISAEGVEGPADTAFAIEVPNEDVWQAVIPAIMILLLL